MNSFLARIVATTFRTLVSSPATVEPAAPAPRVSYARRSWIAVVASLAVWCGVVTGQNDSASQPGSAESAAGQPAQPPGDEAIATFAGGCFWCTEAVFERMEGVNNVVSGYIGGTVPNPNYDVVCTKTSGHAEAVEISYDPNVVSYPELLEVFFKTHDPTTLNEQYPDKGPQYRSAIFIHSAEQKQIAERYIAQLNEQGAFPGKIVTTLEKATRFWEAEEYHQDYFRKHPTAGYCTQVVQKKVAKFDKYFGDKRKKSP